MIAVYSCERSAKGIFVLKVEDDDFSKFLEVLGNSGYPWPTSEVLFIENDEVINTWDINA